VHDKTVVFSVALDTTIEEACRQAESKLGDKLGKRKVRTFALLPGLEELLETSELVADLVGEEVLQPLFVKDGGMVSEHRRGKSEGKGKRKPSPWDNFKAKKTDEWRGMTQEEKDAFTVDDDADTVDDVKTAALMLTSFMK
jgi:hypothetical protein